MHFAGFGWDALQISIKSIWPNVSFKTTVYWSFWYKSFIHFCKQIIKVLCCCSVMQSNSLQSHGLQYTRPPCPSQPPKVCPSSCSLHQWCCPVISSSDILFSFCWQCFPASGTFSMSHLFTSDDQNIGASTSASVLPVNVQGWSPLRWTVFISLLSKGLSGVFFSTTVRRYPFFGILPSLWFSFHNCTWPLEDHSFDYTDLCWQNKGLCFLAHCLGLPSLSC